MKFSKSLVFKHRYANDKFSIDASHRNISTFTSLFLTVSEIERELSELFDKGKQQSLICVKCDFSGNKIDTLTPLFDFLSRKNIAVKIFLLYQNKIGPTALRQITNFILNAEQQKKEATKLEELHLSHNLITSESLIKFFEELKESKIYPITHVKNHHRWCKTTQQPLWLRLNDNLLAAKYGLCKTLHDSIEQSGYRGMTSDFRLLHGSGENNLKSYTQTVEVDGFLTSFMSNVINFAENEDTLIVEYAKSQVEKRPVAHLPYLYSGQKLPCARYDNAAEIASNLSAVSSAHDTKSTHTEQNNSVAKSICTTPSHTITSESKDKSEIESVGSTAESSGIDKKDKSDALDSSFVDSETPDYDSGKEKSAPDAKETKTFSKEANLDEPETISCRSPCLDLLCMHLAHDSVTDKEDWHNEGWDRRYLSKKGKNIPQPDILLDTSDFAVINKPNNWVCDNDIYGLRYFSYGWNYRLGKWDEAWGNISQFAVRTWGKDNPLVRCSICQGSISKLDVARNLKDRVLVYCDEIEANKIKGKYAPSWKYCRKAKKCAVCAALKKVKWIENKRRKKWYVDEDCDAVKNIHSMLPNLHFGLINRLDIQTSGCLTIAKHANAAKALVGIRRSEMRKEYIALVRGCIPLEKSRGTISYLLKGERYYKGKFRWTRAVVQKEMGSNDAENDSLNTVDTENGRTEVMKTGNVANDKTNANRKDLGTQFQVRKYFKILDKKENTQHSYSLVSFKLLSGWRHQIRAHMAFFQELECSPKDENEKNSADTAVDDDVAEDDSAEGDVAEDSQKLTYRPFPNYSVGDKIYCR